MSVGGVGERAFFNMYIGIGYILPTNGGLCRLEGVCAPFGRSVGECAFCNMYICIGH